MQTLAKLSHPSKYPFAKFHEDGAETAPANLVGRRWGENKTNLRIKLTTNKSALNSVPRAGFEPARTFLSKGF